MVTYIKLREAKVTDFNTQTLINEHVVTLDVSVDNS